MDEENARDVVLVRAIESADSEHVIFTNEDRSHASRAAAELARWQAAEQRKASSAELFIGERARLLVQMLQRRSPALARTAHAFEWRSWIGVVLPAVAFAVGAVVEHIADRQHVNVLAFPLFAIILWNVAVYVLLLLRLVAGAGGVGISASGPRRWLAAIAQRSVRARRGAAPESIRAFISQWSGRVAPLMTARAARVLHLSAALLALGAIVGLYVRGLVFEYRAGWESTFLDAPAVHAILSFVLTPAAQLISVPFPNVETIAAMRFVGGAPVAGAGDAALWIHLYAITVGAVVIVPRLALALIAAWQERRRSRFTFDMTEPYFRRLAGPFADGSGGSIRLRVVPYSYSPDEAALQGLRAVATALLGDGAELLLLPPVAFGAEDEVGPTLSSTESPSALTLALFNMAATPETENHGAFLKALRSASAARVAALIDESAFRRRLGGNTERLAERRNAWLSFCQTFGVDATCVDLAQPDLAVVERDLAPSLAATH
ncbi:MAG: DUF2868 domain-containing protein [Burkholderiaceae bacterium]